MRRIWFTGRCGVCGERGRVCWTERGILNREMVKCCEGCVNRIKNWLVRYRRPVEAGNQIPLFRWHDYA